MAGEYVLKLKDAAGAWLADIDGQDAATGYTRLACARRVNEAGLLTFSLAGDHPLVPNIGRDYQVELWRRDTERGIPWYAEFHGLVRDTEERIETEPGTFEASCPGHLSLLGRRRILWAAKATDRSNFVNKRAETIMKLLVRYNAGADATTANGRKFAGTITGLTVEADGARGSVVDSRGNAWRNLLEELQEIAGIGDGDFDLVKTGPQAWDFRFYPGQRGDDRRTSILFALERGNMLAPKLRIIRSGEANVAVVGGQGEESSRAVRVVQGAGWSSAYSVETFVDARDDAEAGSLVTQGRVALREMRTKQEFEFGVIQSGGTAYGRDYFLGDLVRARFRGVTYDRKVVGVSIELGNEGERIEVETEPWP